jgi:rubrerythrin
MKKSEEQDKIKYKIKSIEEEIKENQKEYERLERNNLGGILIVLGVIGLFLFIVPGIIFFIIAGAVSNNNKKQMLEISTRIKELERQLADLKGTPVEEEEEKEGLQCSKCGADISEKDKFCPNCGARFVEKK